MCPSKVPDGEARGWIVPIGGAENMATWGSIWLYPSQADGWVMVPVSKMGSWFLLMILSFVLVSLLHRPRSMEGPPDAAAIAASK